MLATITKQEESAALKILCDAYLAKGGKVTTFRNMSPELRRARRAQGLPTPRQWDANARAQFAADDKAYYHIADQRKSLPVYDPASADNSVDGIISERRQMRRTTPNS